MVWRHHGMELRRKYQCSRLVQPCPRGGSCAFPTPTNLTPQLLEAQAALANDSTKLQTAKQAMDESLLALTGNGTEIANDVYTTAVRSRDHLRNAQAAVDDSFKTPPALALGGMSWRSGATSAAASCKLCDRMLLRGQSRVSLATLHTGAQAVLAQEASSPSPVLLSMPRLRSNGVKLPI
eukprot:g10003.t1